MEKFLMALKQRAGFFLGETGEFPPFRANLRTNGEIRDIKNYPETSVEERYELLLGDAEQDLKDGGIEASAIVLSGKVDGSDAVVIEIFRNCQEKYQAVFPYVISGETVTFGEDSNKKLSYR